MIIQKLLFTMNRTSVFARLLGGLAVLLASSFGNGTHAAQKQEKPNVLFIAIDDFNDYLGLLRGHPGIKTPNLDRFAETAVTFTHAYCTAPICNPSRTAIISGVAPWKSGVYMNNDHFKLSQPAREAVSLPEHFQKNGYRTMISGKVYHSTPPGFKKYWNDSRNIAGGYGPRATEKYIPDSVERPPLFNYQAWSGADEDFPDVQNATISVKRLQTPKKMPFFLAHGIYRPHNPWTAPKRFFDMHPLESLTMPPVKEDDLADLSETAREWAAYPVSLKALQEAKQWKPVVQAYFASVSFMDETFGKLINALDQGPHADNTIVVVFSDHGFHLGEKEHFAKYALWELTTHVPLLVRLPQGKHAGSRCDGPVTLIDLYPTLVDLCGLPQPETTLDGRSFASLVREPNASWEHPAVTIHGPGNVAVRDRKWRYIRYADGSEELYDHSQDPHEWENLAGREEFVEIKKHLSKAIPTSFATPVREEKAAGQAKKKQ
ncbi:Iduronate sulfatase [Planctomycetales bacterium 10988]|nr:Iduronate sulfatase [Planctomycetales bacterium 10988]